MHHILRGQINARISEGRTEFKIIYIVLGLGFELILYLFSSMFFILPSLIKKVVRCGMVVQIWVEFEVLSGTCLELG